MEHKTWNNKWVFFGSDEFSIGVLEELIKAGFPPALIVTIPDKPKGRGLFLTPPPIKLWAIKNGIPFSQPTSLSDSSLLSHLSSLISHFFILASYGKIIPKSILDIPKFGALNVHPSLLPKFRGASPIQSTILSDEKETGVTIMLMDEKMDHGPIVAQNRLKIQDSRFKIPSASELKSSLARSGGELLARVIPDWAEGKIKATPQDDALATYCQKIEKSDGLIELNSDPRKNYLKIQALGESPGAYFFANKKNGALRVLIKKASYEDGKLIIERVLPAGKREMDYGDFLRGE